jgi:hypothetical protein
MNEHQRSWPRSAADEALLEAIDVGIEERNAFPDGASFIDAEQPSAGKAIARAAAAGRPVVLCSADGARQVLLPSQPAAA